MDYDNAVKQLYARGFGVRADLARITALTELLDHPERNYPSIHVSGTNGKSSVTRMIAAILGGHGIATGAYTSPHLQSPRERFLIAAPTLEQISKNDFSSTHEYLLPFAEIVENDRGETVTYFEMTTAMAFEWMAAKTVGAGVFEVGMGGEWDATNLIQAEVAILTHIDVDHRKFLGETPVANAREKVGIIKKGATVVTAEQDPGVLEVIGTKVAEQGAALLMPGKHFDLWADSPAVGGRLVTISGTQARYQDLFLPLHGSHQAANLVLAVAAAEAFLGRALDEKTLSDSISRITSPGRLEVVHRGPLVVLDGAHNPDAARNLGNALRESFGDLPITFVVSIFEDKDWEGFLLPLLPFADRMIFTRHTSDRKTEDPESLAGFANTAGVEATIAPTLREALDAAIPLTPEEEMIVVTGSLHAVGEARDHLLGPLD